MSIYLSPLRNVSSPALPPFVSIHKKFQDSLMYPAISSSSLEQILVSNPSFVNQPLPNGEYPLHTLVRETGQNREIQLEKVKVLLLHGADIGLKDAQKLTALDHAALIKDQQLLINLLGLSIGKDLNETQKQIEISGDAENIENLLLDQQTLCSVSVNELSPIAKAAYQGDLSTFSVQDMIVSPLNGREESALHFAIKGKQLDLVKKLINQMKQNHLEINLLDMCRNSLLHYAVAVDVPEIVKCLVDAGVGVEQRNTRGETPLHFAAAFHQTHLMQLLVKEGASLKVVDAGGRTPLVLYAQITKSLDPLAINAQLTLATLTACYWIGQVAQSSGWAIPFQEVIMPTLFVAVSISEFSYLISNLNANWKKFSAFATYWVLGYLPPFNFCYQLWRVSHLAKEMFSSIGAAWKNIRYRKWDSLYKLTVSSINTASSVDSLYRSYQSNKYWYDVFYSEEFAKICTLLTQLKTEGFSLEAFHDFPQLKDKLEVILVKWKYDSLSVFDDILEVIELITGYTFNKPTSPFSSQTCSKIDPEVSKLSDPLKRVSHASLKPECPDHAAIILSDDFNKTRFCEQAERKQRDQKYLNRLYRDLSKKLHPDKNPGTDKIFIKIGAAKETLIKKENMKIYCKT